jgi:hypothetical protein
MLASHRKTKLIGVELAYTCMNHPHGIRPIRPYEFVTGGSV